MEYFKHNPLEPVDYSKFESECGVGVVISPAQIEAAVEEVMAKHKSGLLEQRYRYNVGLIMGKSQAKINEYDQSETQVW